MDFLTPEEVSKQNPKEFFRKIWDYSEFIFFMMAGWVVSITLAHKDDSPCLDDHYQGVPITFRTWMYTNGFIVLAGIVMTFVDFLFKRCLNSRLKTLTDKILHSLLLTLKFLIAFGKLAWMAFGTFIFIKHLNFNSCSDQVVTYTGAQILAFLGMIIAAIVLTTITFYDSFG